MSPLSPERAPHRSRSWIRATVTNLSHHRCQPQEPRVRHTGALRGAVDQIDIQLFITTTYPRLVAAVALVAGSRAAGEDAVQEALVRAWEYTERGGTIDSLPAWVTTASLNLARSAVRRVLAERRLRSRMPETNSRSRDQWDASTLDVRRALAGLPRRQREVTVLRYYGGFDVHEIATILAVSDGTVKTLLHRGRQRLAGVLGEGSMNGGEVSVGSRAV